MNQKREQILAAVKKLGPSSPLQISDHTGLSSSLCGYHLRGLVEAGLVKATGSTASRKYEAIDGAPPQDRKPPAKRKKKRASKKPRAARPRPAESEFIAAVTHDARIVVIDGNAIKTYSPEQSSAIADLALTHFTA